MPGWRGNHSHGLESSRCRRLTDGITCLASSRLKHGEVHRRGDPGSGVEIDFDVVPAIADAKMALEPHAPVVHAALGSGNLCLDFRLGNAAGTAAALQDALVVDLEL